MSFLPVEQLPLELQQAITYHNLAAGQILFQQHEPAEAVFFVESGQLKLVSFTQEQIITHYFVEAGENFALTALFSEKYICTAIANIPSRVGAIPKQLFMQALRDSTDLTQAYIQEIIDRLHQVKILLELRSIHSARERFLCYLMFQTQPNQTTVELKRSLKDVASELGLVPETFSRLLARLEDEGVITRHKRTITFEREWLLKN